MANVVAFKNRRPNVFENDFPFGGLDRLFDDFFGNFPKTLANTKADTFRPHIEVHEEADHLMLTAELPGVDPKEIDLYVEDDTLILRGEKTSKNENKNKERYYTERFYGSFERRINLGDRFDVDKIDASYKNGVLEVKLPRKALPEAQSKRIEIK